MGWFDFLRPRAKTVDINDGSWTFLSGQNLGWTAADKTWGRLTVAEQEQAYNQNAIVQACVRCIATTAAEPRVEVGSWLAGVWKALPAHPVIDLLAQPNATYSFNDFVQYITARLELTGRYYVQKLRNRGRSMVTELWPLPSSWVTEESAQGGTALVAGYRVHGQQQIVPVGDIVTGRLVDPYSTNQGSSPLVAASKDYRLEQEREAYLAEMLVNLKLPGLVVYTERPMSPTEKTTLKSDLATTTGRGHRGNTVTMSGGAKLEMPNPLGDMDWPGLTGLIETRICAAFGVPPILIGCRAGLERSTYSNYISARKSFYQETMVPLWKSLGDSLTHGLLRQEGDRRLSIRFRYDEMREAQQETYEERSKRAALLLAGNIITQEEARKIAGVEDRV